jgi:hypothetical protein
MPKRVEPKHFYLNEQHELSHLEREGGGRLPKLGEIDWASKQRYLTKSLSRTRKAIEQSSDPLRGQRYFLLARPEETVPKLTSDKRKAPSGHFDEPVDYAGKDSRVLSRLGLDVISVTDQGAVVHATPERFERLESIASNLGELGKAEQARWAFVADFEVVPPELRADEDWLASVRKGTHETIVELQPLLSRTEGALVLNVIAEHLRRADGEAILASGTDFSGRAWVRATFVARTIARIVKDFFSVQALHGPLLSPAFAVGSRRAGNISVKGANLPSLPVAEMPVVAVVDTGVAQNHVQLEPYRRGKFVHPQGQDGFDDHGTFVTSRVVFGDPSDPLNSPPTPQCRFIDVIVARDSKSIDTKIVVNAIEIVGANYPDARTFNLSFGDYVALNLRQTVDRTQRLLQTQDLDNLIFARDLLVVVAAGNSRPGVTPNPAYAEHWQDPTWGLGHWAVGFNTLKCGSFVREWTIVGGVADVPFAPSPFCKVGPALADAPAPDFSAHGGNCNAGYGHSPGLGVWGLSPAGLWEDRLGTSHATPILSRQCAFALALLQRVCPAGTSPFGVTAKAFLALTADPILLPTRFGEAAARTLGLGRASSERLSVPDADRAIFVWQGVLGNKSDVARVIVPIPGDWLEEADDPVCDIAVSWDSPVNAAFTNVYGCRRVNVKLKPTPDADAVRGSRGAHQGYPLRVRTYGLKKALDDGLVEDDLWIVELSYEEMCDYPPTQVFTPEQRVAFALQLRDRDGTASPQAAVQAIEMTSTMTRLSAAPIPLQVPVTVKKLT